MAGRFDAGTISSRHWEKAAEGRRTPGRWRGAMSLELRGASWTAPVLWRFAARTEGQPSHELPSIGMTPLPEPSWANGHLDGARFVPNRSVVASQRCFKIIPPPLYLATRCEFRQLALRWKGLS